MDRPAVPFRDAGALAERQAFYARLAPLHMSPLWEVLGALVPRRPASPAATALWRYADVREHVLEAGRLITADEAERRVLVLENPALPHTSSITQSLYAGLQLILPGEVAPAHRHTQSALRLVLEGEGAYTAVDGERTTMRFGDFILTPSWTFHDHGNAGSEPVVWLDGLDIPLVRFLDAGFAEKADTRVQVEARPEGDALHRYGSGLLPMDHRPASHEPSKTFVYPYARTREALAGASRGERPDPHHATRLRFVNPATGRSPMPTIGTWVQRLEPGFATRPVRSSDGTVHVCLEGSGTARIGGGDTGTDAETVFRFGPRDVFVVPSWRSLALEADPGSEATVLFAFSDRPVQEALGLWREQKEA